MAGCGEVEVLASDGEVIDEGDAATGGVAFVSPVAGFEERGAEEADLEDFAADAVDLYGVSDADPVAAHEDEPADEGEDELLECDGETGGGEAEDGGELAGDSEDEEEDAEDADELNGKLDDGAEGARAANVQRGAREQAANEPRSEHDADDDENYQCDGLQDEVEEDSVLEENLYGPLLVDGGELLLGEDAVVVDGEELALGGLRF